MQKGQNFENKCPVLSKLINTNNACKDGMGGTLVSKVPSTNGIRHK